MRKSWWLGAYFLFIHRKQSVMVSLPSGGPGASSLAQTETMHTSPSSGYATIPSAKAKPGNGMVNGSNVSHPPAHSIPLSSRRSQRLDMSTVERKGQKQDPCFSKKKVSSSLHGLTEALTFRPSDDDFKDPMEYIRSIAPQGKMYGIVKIIPPENWNPDFAIDTEVSAHANTAQRLLLVLCTLDIQTLVQQLTYFSDSISGHANKS